MGILWLSSDSPRGRFFISPQREPILFNVKFVQRQLRDNSLNIYHGCNAFLALFWSFLTSRRDDVTKGSLIYVMPLKSWDCMTKVEFRNATCFSPTGPSSGLYTRQPVYE
jgi:hypothetical protein